MRKCTTQFSRTKRIGSEHRPGSLFLRGCLSPVWVIGMNITVICVGKVKERFYREAVEEYAKRLGRYCRFEIEEVADERTPDGAGPGEEEQIRAREAQRILARIRPDSYVCTLEIAGRELSSVEMADWLEQLAVGGRSRISFVIGGSLGLHDSVLRRSDFALSFSRMTFPHQLMRVILSEQLYRAFRIINKEPYHK